MIPDLQFIYIHGFNSSPQSQKARYLLKLFESQGRSAQISVPQLSHWPQKAVEQLIPLVEDSVPVVLLGSSLGGFYATWLSEHFAHVRAVLINPAVAPQRLLKTMLGPTENFYTAERYELTNEHIAQLEQLYLPELKAPERLLLLQQEGDETLDYRDAVRYYSACKQIVQPGGNHGFEGFDQIVPEIFRFASQSAPR